MSPRAHTSTSAVVAPAGDSEVVIVMPGVWPPAATQSVGLWRRLRRRLHDRWPSIKRSLPRDLALLLLLFVVTRHAGVAWVMTDSVNKSMVVVLKGATVRPGELAVFSYSGSAIPGYYPATWWSELLTPLGWSRPVAGPAKGDGFVKYLLGVPGDRIEVDGRQVWLITPRGRVDAGLCKTHTRKGVPLQPISSQTIPPGYVYMWAPHADALDSRYAVMGLVPAKAINGKAVPLW
jgi:conjugal transfer pilin signal peptidase TrbI